MVGSEANMVVKLLFSGFVLIGLGSAALAEAPRSASDWQSTSLSVAECLQRAEKAIRKVGFVTNFKSVAEGKEGSVTGNHGNYGVQLRCIGEKQIMFVFVVGPDDGQSDRFLEAVLANF